MSNKPLEYTYEIYINAPCAKVWTGLVDGDLTRRYVYGTRFESTLQKGAPYAFVGDDDFKAVDGEVIDVQPARRLVITWSAHWDELVSKDRASRVTYELIAAGAKVTKLRLLHDDFDEVTPTYSGSIESWPLMLSSLKSLIETGEPLEADVS